MGTAPNKLLNFSLNKSKDLQVINQLKKGIIITMSAKKPATKPKQATFLELVIKAIPAIKDRKGASRAAIAKWIQTNCGKEGGGQFNAALRKALTKGIESGVLKQGNTDQRYRIGELPKPK